MVSVFAVPHSGQVMVDSRMGVTSSIGVARPKQPGPEKKRDECQRPCGRWNAHAARAALCRRPLLPPKQNRAAEETKGADAEKEGSVGGGDDAYAA